MSNPTYDKVVRDGKAAVLVSPGFGAGWYSWNDYEALLFHPKLVELVEQDRKSEITEELCRQLLDDPDVQVYCGGAEQLKIVWVPVGTLFRIDEYDGAETLMTQDGDSWHIA